MAIKQGRITFHAELMSAEDMRHPIRLEKFVDHPRPERVTRASIRQRPREGNRQTSNDLGLREKGKKKKKMNKNGQPPPLIKIR